MRDTATIIHRNSEGTPDCVVLLTFDFQEEEGHWVGVCRGLGTVAKSKIREQAREQLRKAVELRINELESLSDIEECLRDNDARIMPIPPIETIIGQRPKMTPEQIRKDLERFRAAGRKWREEHPDEYDENYPPSIAWQDELYDEDGLPK